MEKLESSQLSLRDFLHVIFKRKFQILIFFIVTVFMVALGTFIKKPLYKANAHILVKMGRENLYVPPNSTNNQIINFKNDDQINSEIELLKSRSLAEKVIKSIGLKTIYNNLNETDAVLKFQNSLSIEGIKESSVINISFEHNDPKTAATIVNTLVNNYLDQHLRVHKTPQSFNFFKEQSQVLKNKLEAAEGAFKALKKQHNITALSEEQRILLNQMADLGTELDHTLSQEAETGRRILQIRRQLENTPETIQQGEEIDHNPLLISEIEKKLVELELKEKDLIARYTPQNHLVQNVKQEIKIVQEKLDEQQNKRHGKSLFGPNPTYQRLQEELYKNQAESKALAAKKETQNSQFANYQHRLDQFNRIEVELSRLQQEADVDRQNYRLYMTKFEESRISDAMDNKKISNVSLIEPALSPLKPVDPNVVLNLLLSIFLGGFGGLGLAFLGEYLDDRIEKPDDVEKILQIPVLASIPEMDIKKYQQVNP